MATGGYDFGSSLEEDLTWRGGPRAGPARHFGPLLRYRRQRKRLWRTATEVVQAHVAAQQQREAAKAPPE